MSSEAKTNKHPSAIKRRPSFVADFLRLQTHETVHETKVSQENEQIENSIHQACQAVLLRQYFGDVEKRLLDVFGDKKSQKINVFKFFTGLLETGLRLNDPRLKEMVQGLKKMQENVATVDDGAIMIDYELFLQVISKNMDIIVKAFNNSFVIPDFGGFANHIDLIFNNCESNRNGDVASYIPQLERMSRDYWGVSVCSVDGQRHNVGDCKVPFSIQSCSKPLNYAMAASEVGSSTFHTYVGMEPSGRGFNDLSLDHDNKPHNPMINAGAIMTASLIKPHLSKADRFDYMFKKYQQMCGNEYLGFNNSVFLSEKECADRNYALAYFMREKGCFPNNTSITEVLDFYFQLCSLEITAESGSVIAATLANGGINPLTGENLFNVESVRNTLTLMHSCGMYNYSGRFAFEVGLPAKSGVSGCILLVVPNTVGICLWAPPLDENGNSCKGVQFCEEFVSKFRFHHFDNLRARDTTEKMDPRMGKNENKAQTLFELLFAVGAGDLTAVQRHALSGNDLEAGDYDGRTALHVAASEGHEAILEFLLDKCLLHPDPKDRWGRTPLEDAINFKNEGSQRIIERHLRDVKTKEIESGREPTEDERNEEKETKTKEIESGREPTEDERNEEKETKTEEGN